MGNTGGVVAGSGGARMPGLMSDAGVGSSVSTEGGNAGERQAIDQSAVRAGGAGAGGAGAGGAGAGGAGAAVGAIHEVAGAPNTVPCPYYLSQSCWVTTWAVPRIPIELDGALSAEEGLLVGQATASWEAAPMPENFLQFLRGASGRKLTFYHLPGCGLRDTNDDEVQFAMADCNTAVDVEREIGVALGIPRTNQRVDRDEYLELAPAYAFSCTDALNGNVYGKCDDKGGTALDIGTFDFRSVMMGDAISTNAKGCELAPDGARLFRSWVVLPDASTPCAQDVFSPVSVSVRDKAALIELYSLDEGWTPFRRLKATVDNGTFLPTGDPSIVALGSGDLRALSFGNDGRLWQLGYDSGTFRWGSWDPLEPPAPSGSGGAVGAVSVGKDSWAGEGSPSLAIGVVSKGFVYVIGVSENAWSNLGSPPGGALSAPALAGVPRSTIDLFVVGADGQLWCTEWDGDAWSVWARPRAPQQGLSLIGQPAAVGRTTGELAVAARATDGSLWFLSRGIDRSWSDWLQIGSTGGSGIDAPSITAFGVNRLRVFVRGREGFLWQKTRSGFAWSDFEPLGGVLTHRPAADTTVVGGTDLVTTMTAPNSGLTDIWIRHLAEQ